MLLLSTAQPTAMLKTLADNILPRSCKCEECQDPEVGALHVFHTYACLPPTVSALARRNLL